MDTVVIVKFNHSYPPYNAGEIAGFSIDQAERILKTIERNSMEKVAVEVERKPRTNSIAMGGGLSPMPMPDQVPEHIKQHIERAKADAIEQQKTLDARPDIVAPVVSAEPKKSPPRK